MYPLITIGSLTIDMTALGIVTWVLTFLFTSRYLCRQTRIQFIKLFYRLPVPILLTYFLSTYISFALSQWARLPTNTAHIMQRLSPHGYRFHIAGIIMWLTITIRLFLKQMPSRHERRIWINIIATSLSVALIPLGIGLLMGNHFVGLPTESMRWIETFRADISTRSDYGSVYPVGLMISALGVILFVIHRIGQHHNTNSPQWYITLALMACGISIINTYTNSAKYLVTYILNMRRDSIVYMSLLIGAILLQHYMVETHRINRKP